MGHRADHLQYRPPQEHRGGAPKDKFYARTFQRVAELPSFDTSMLDPLPPKPTDAIIGLGFLAFSLSSVPPPDVFGDGHHTANADALHASGVAIVNLSHGIGDSIVSVGAGMQRSSVMIFNTAHRAGVGVHDQLLRIGKDAKASARQLFDEPPVDFGAAIQAGFDRYVAQETLKLKLAWGESVKILANIRDIVSGCSAKEPQSAIATPTIRASIEFSDKGTIGLTNTYKTGTSPEDKIVNTIVRNASAKFSEQTGKPISGVTIDVVMPSQVALLRGDIPNFRLQDQDGRLYVPFYEGPNLIRYIPVPAAGYDASSIDWTGGTNPQLKIHHVDGSIAVYDQSLGAFITLPKDTKDAIDFAIDAQTRGVLRAFIDARYKESGDKAVVLFTQYSVYGKPGLLAEVVAANPEQNSTWMARKDGKIVKFPTPKDGYIWVIAPDGLIFQRRKGQSNMAPEPGAGIFDPNEGSDGKESAFALPTATATATATRAATTAPTLAPTLKPPEPTKIPLPEKADIALYGKSELRFDFRVMQSTNEVFFNPRTWGTLKEPKVGVVQGIAYLTAQTIDAYNRFRDGKSSGGDIFPTSSINFLVKEVEVVDSAAGIFLVRSDVVNAFGVTVTVEVKMNSNNPVYMHIPESDKRWGSNFCLLIGSAGPIGANSGIVRVGDVVGFAGPKDKSEAANMAASINAVKEPNIVKKFNGYAQEPENSWFLIYPH